jgi:hypothetical protein
MTADQAPEQGRWQVFCDNLWGSNVSEGDS